MLLILKYASCILPIQRYTGQFDGVSDEVDFVIENDGYKKSVSDMAREIINLYYNN